MNGWQKLGLALVVFAAVEFLGALWWWALVGLSDNLWTAHGVTASILAIAATAAFGAGIE